MQEHIVTVKGMSKAFPTGEGDFLALKNIDLVFGKGEFTGIVGPSGSGKTTLLNVIGSLDVPSSGEVEVLGHKISKLSPVNRQSCAASTSALFFRPTTCCRFIMCMKTWSFRCCCSN